MKDTSTNMVTAKLERVNGSYAIATGVYIYGYPTWEVTGPTSRGSGDNPGNPGELIQNAFTARIKDGKNSAIPGVRVQFNRDNRDGETNGDLIFGSGNSGTFVNETNQLMLDTNNNPITGGERNPQHVRTNSSGVASVDFRLGSAGKETVDVTAPNLDLTAQNDIEAYSGSKAGTDLSLWQIQSYPSNSNAFDLYARVMVDGKPPASGQANEKTVIFRTSDGLLGPGTGTSATTTKQEETATNANEGIVEVYFESNGLSSNPQVTISIKETISGVVTETHTKTINVRSGSTTQPQQPNPTQPSTGTPGITLNLDPIRGAPDDTVTLQATVRDTSGNVRHERNRQLYNQR